MGGGRNYNSNGGFDVYNWETKETIDGIKVITKKDTSNNSLPQYSNTSSTYIRKDGDDYVQIREYKDRLVLKDIDLFVDNKHTNKNGEVFTTDVVHVHDWYKKKNGKWDRHYKARYLTEEEISKWGDLIKKLNPKIKLRP